MCIQLKKMMKLGIAGNSLQGILVLNCICHFQGFSILKGATECVEDQVFSSKS